MANKKRLIDANALEQIFLDESRRLRKQIVNDQVSCEEANYIRSFMPTIEWARKTVHGCATVDAVEVAHGEWIMVIDENDCECIECPLCGEQFYDGDNDTFDKPYNYCHNCGAKMDGDGNG